MFQFTLTPSTVSKAEDCLALRDTKAAKDKSRNQVPVMFLSSLPRSLLDKHRTISKQKRQCREKKRGKCDNQSALTIPLPSVSSHYKQLWAWFWGDYEALLSSNPSCLGPCQLWKKTANSTGCQPRRPCKVSLAGSPG